MRMLAVGARLQGINAKYNEKEALVFMLKIVATIARAGGREEIREFLNGNPVPASIRSLGYRTIVDDLLRAMELPS